VAAAILRKNEDTLILPFSTTLFDTKDLNSRDSVMTNAQFLATCGGGGTNCSLPLAYLNAKQTKADLVFYVSDNESWADRNRRNATGLQAEWAAYKRKFPKAKLVLLDITPGATSQAVSDKDILRIGGFSDDVFQILPDFLDGKYGADAWVEKISKISLDPTAASGE
jgi:60 kDa SS-A/Ro ribonucleoprotein